MNYKSKVYFKYYKLLLLDLGSGSGSGSDSGSNSNSSDKTSLISFEKIKIEFSVDLIIIEFDILFNSLFFVT